ncbi:predicted N-acetyltransferase YhbS [Rhizobium subbaraonis]|uniref:Predicted N-acetyltransferase YhbS n=1 Tax=Rhizobium subbaraonis TaxID=908946 RepID=A0A285USC0_9HYPH|nr:GNAT family N-acetyltransferase [Rhizobium subbaraonis]SOC44298.1 predicted N-acetyltransferase YhbS [Rhizobium subbaraonis]
MTDDRAGLIFREDYFGDPAGWAAVKALLVDVFGVDVSPLDRLGGPDQTLMSSAWFDESARCVANFSAFSMPLVIDGRPVKAAALQSGAVLPQYRGRGLFRDLVRRVLQRCDAQGFEAILLYTDKPQLYEPYGFGILPEHRFAGGAPAVSAASPSFRTLDMNDADDVSLVRGLLESRAAVSQRLAVIRNMQTFLLNTVLVQGVTFSLLPQHSAVVAWSENAEGTVFTLHDVVAASMPSLCEILQAIGRQPERVEVLFAPDQLGWQGEGIPEDGDLRFMLRSQPGLSPNGPCRLSPMAEF